MRDFGIVKPGTTLYIPFATYDSNDPSASVTNTGLATTDIEIYKDGSVTQRASDAGYTLLDTDGIDFDGITGIHGFSVDLADNTTAGFYAAGSQYWVVVSSITVDAATINFIAATFRIGYPDAVLNTTIATLSTQTSFTLTAGPAEDDALNGCVCCIHDVASAVQLGFAVVSDYTGSTKTVTLTAGTSFTAAATDNIAFYPPANTRWLGATAQTGNDVGQDVNDILVDTGTTLQGELDGIQADTEDIQARLPAALVSGRIDATVDGTGMEAGAVTAIQSGLATAADLATVAGYLDTEIAAILADTNELQTDWADGGRLDLILDARASQASVDDVPTNAELTAAIAAGLDAAIPGTPTAGSINDVLKDLDARLPGSGTLSTLTAANVNSEVVDALATDTYAEPGQGAPAATTTLAAKINYLYKAWRNKKDNNGTTTNLYADDATTVDQKQATSESGGTVTKGEWETGP